MAHAVPFQCSTSVLCWWTLVCSFSYIPTAQTLFGETTVTLRSWLLALDAVLMFGLGTSLQVLPFQWSVNVTSAPVEAVVDPTAQASVGEIARTESRLLHARAVARRQRSSSPIPVLDEIVVGVGSADRPDIARPGRADRRQVAPRRARVRSHGPVASAPVLDEPLVVAGTLSADPRHPCSRSPQRRSACPTRRRRRSGAAGSRRCS